jgi:hypothetical protein
MKRYSFILVAAFSAWGACVKSPPAPASPELVTAVVGSPARGPFRAEAMSFDGFTLGSRYGSQVMPRAPYREPCDDDPIDRRSQRFMVYGGLPCRGRAFPESTTVMFYLPYVENRGAPYDEPIVAFAWMGGSYFTTRTNFPLRTGEPALRAAEVLGSPVVTFPLRRKRSRLLVQRHPGEIYSLVDADRLVGFVVGAMPEDPKREQWRGLMQMYDRYTPKP